MSGSSEAEERMVKFKVWLPGSYRSLWRKVQVSDSTSLAKMADLILDAFNFDHDHLYAFIFKGKPWDQGAIKFVHPRADGMKADKMSLGNLDLKPGQRFTFLYDFGDEWPFLIRVVSLDPGSLPEPIITGRGKPPEQYSESTATTGAE